jgi:predicted dehydrogenase
MTASATAAIHFIHAPDASGLPNRLGTPFASRASMDPNKTRKVRYAVIGLGNVAQEAVLPAFEHASDSSELVALVSSDAPKLAKLASRYDVKVTGAYEDLERVIESARVDAVYVAVPTALHREMTERAARAGASVLCEKPMAPTASDCEAMIAACDDHGVKLMIAYRLHFEAANLRAVERVRRGEIGEPRIFSSLFSHEARGGGALLDMGIYCVNAARYVFGDEPLSVLAMQTASSEEQQRHVDETTSVVMRFPGDRLAQFTASQSASAVSEFRVIGTKGAVEIDPAFEHGAPTYEILTVDGELRERRGKRKDPLAPEISHFSSCILEDRTPQPSGEEGLADIRVLEAIVKSAATREVVQLAPRERGQRRARKPIARPRPVQAPPPSK